MRELSVFLTGRRYSVPTLRLAVPVADGDEDVVAQRILDEDPAYELVELGDGDHVVGRARRDGPARSRLDSRREHGAQQ